MFPKDADLKMTEWLAPGFGLVKSVTTSNWGGSKTQVISIKKPEYDSIGEVTRGVGPFAPVDRRRGAAAPFLFGIGRGDTLEARA